MQGDGERERERREEIKARAHFSMSIRVEKSNVSQVEKIQLALIKDFQADNNAARLKAASLENSMLLDVKLFIVEFHPLKYCFLTPTHNLPSLSLSLSHTHTHTQTHTHTHTRPSCALFPAAGKRSPFPWRPPRCTAAL